MLKFEWDEEKAASNYTKHGVLFEETASVFGDPLTITFPDPDHSVGEKRMLTFGVSRKNRLLVWYIQNADVISESSVSVRQRDMSEVFMSKGKEEMRVEYRREDLGKGVRGKYLERYAKGTNLVLLNDKVAKAFPTTEAVNEALLDLLALTEKTARVIARPGARGVKRRVA